MEPKSNLLQNVYLKAIFPNMIAILGGTINIFVDGILIGQKMGDMGIADAAWASVTATVITCGICFYILCGKGSVFQVRPRKLNLERLKKIFISGSPMAANNLFSTARILVLNFIMNLAGGSSLVTVFAITNNLNEFSICVQNGIPQTGSALLGVYHGENDSRALKKLLLLQLKSGVVISTVVAGIIAVFSGKVGFLFGSHLDVRVAVICWAVSLIFATCNNVMNYYYYSIRQAARTQYQSTLGLNTLIVEI